MVDSRRVAIVGKRLSKPHVIWPPKVEIRPAVVEDVEEREEEESLGDHKRSNHAG
jgi:hypothetical protein